MRQVDRHSELVLQAQSPQTNWHQRIDELLIVGTGVQARYQAQYICQEMDITKVILWGRDENKTISQMISIQITLRLKLKKT